MQTKEELNPTLEDKTPWVRPGTYSPVTVTDTVGAVFLGILAVILLIALIRAEARNHVRNAD